MNVLAIVAHADDETLGCGATLAKHSMDGDTVDVLVLCGKGMRSAEQLEAGIKAAGALGLGGFHNLDLEDQHFDTYPILKITQMIEEQIAQFDAEIIYTHHAGDLNRDHQLTAQAVMTACRPLPGSLVKAIYGFEVLSSTEWGTGFHPQHFVNVTGEPFTRKAQALRCYEKEMRPEPHARSMSGVFALGCHRGHTIGVPYAEAFTVLRQIA